MDDAREPGGSEVRSELVFTWAGLLVWMIVAGLLGWVTAWLSFAAQTTLGFAPALLFPVLAGALLGVLLAAARRFAQCDHTPTLLLGTALAVLLAVAGQHFLGYRHARQEDRKSPELELARAAFPELAGDSFWGYLRAEARSGRPVGDWFVLRGTAVWASWGVDAAILGLAAWCGMFVFARRGRPVEQDRIA